MQIFDDAYCISNAKQWAGVKSIQKWKYNKLCYKIFHIISLFKQQVPKLNFQKFTNPQKLICEVNAILTGLRVTSNR